MADGADLFLSLPEDAVTLIAAYLGHPRHFMALCLTSRRLYHPLRASSSPAWLSLASSSASDLSPSVLNSWHALSSLPYLSICRFLLTASRLHSSLWAHKSPELGNLVVSLWGFLSLVFVRIVPQKVSGSLALSPVMEIHCDADGAPTIFFLHGKDDSVHAGSLFDSAIPSDPTLLLLEADHFSPANSKNMTSLHDPSIFQNLEFDDRDWLLDFLSSKSAMKLPPDLQSAPIVPRSHDDFNILSRRREMLISMHKAIRGGLIDCATIESSLCSSSTTSGGNESFEGDVEYSSSNDCENGDDLLIEYLRTGNGDSIGLSLRATDTPNSFYWSWPEMRENCFGLYKLPVSEPEAGKELSGLWGGSFGWPPTLPGHDDVDKSNKYMILLLLSYHETREGLVLVGTKILDYYASYPIGSSMFTANLEEPSSTDAFPWEITEMEVECSFRGEGISDGYGFRYPGSKPGTLFCLNNGLLAFVWGESGAVLTLERIDLAAMVAKGYEQVPVILSAVSNFTILMRTRLLSNVYTDSRCFEMRFYQTPRTRQQRKRGPAKPHEPSRLKPSHWLSPRKIWTRLSGKLERYL